MISSERSHVQTYGYWEIRARFTNTSQGHHWAMWLAPQDGSWPPEIDIVVVVCDNPNRFYMNSHGDGGPLTWFSPEDPRGWHTWGLLWTPDDLVWYVDQVERKRIRNFIDKPLYWLLSPEIGGNWAGNPDGSTVWPMEAEVDYVRAYELGSAGTPDITAPSVPADLTATAVSSSMTELSWAPSTDDVGHPL
jgi:beta-glucanase (GH16 family)